MVIDDCVVVNLSTVRLMTDQLGLLALSPKYCPSPCTLDCQRRSQDITEECHRIRLKELYELVNRLHIDRHIDNITCRWALVEPNNVKVPSIPSAAHDLQDVDEPARVTHHVMCKRTHLESVQAHGPLDTEPHCQPVQLQQGHDSHAAYKIENKISFDLDLVCHWT